MKKYLISHSEGVAFMISKTKYLVATDANKKWNVNNIKEIKEKEFKSWKKLLGF